MESINIRPANENDLIPFSTMNKKKILMTIKKTL